MSFARRIVTQHFPIVIVLVVLAAVPIFASTYWLVVLFLWFLYTAMAEMWNLLAGYSGLVSLGQQIFIGLGGYMVAIVSLFWGYSVWLGVILGGVISIFFALAMSIPTFRMKGMFFAIGTWVVAEAVRVWFSNWEYIKSGMGLFIRPAFEITTVELYYIAFVVGFASVFFTQMILKSKFGLGLTAIRDNETSASSSGVDIFRTKLTIFVIAAFITGVAAGIFYLYQVFIQPFSAFSIAWTVILVTAVIIGGIGTVEGPLVGAAIAVLLQQWLSRYIGISLLIQGIITIAVISLAPRGIVGTLKRTTRYQGLVGRAIRIPKVSETSLTPTKATYTKHSDILGLKMESRGAYGFLFRVSDTFRRLPLK